MKTVADQFASILAVAGVKRIYGKWVSLSRMLAQLVVSGNGKPEASRRWG